MSGGRLLITGFGPFPGIPANPSATLAKRLAADLRLKRAGILAAMRLIPTEYAAAEALIPALAAPGPAAVLMFGVAGRRRFVSVELAARNKLALLAPDAAGVRPARLLIAPGGPARLMGRAPMARMVQAGRGAGARVRPSRNAGAYLCNFAYWKMLAALPAQTPCVFVHIPKVGGRRAMDRLVMAAAAMAKPLMAKPVAR